MAGWAISDSGGFLKPQDGMSATLRREPIKGLTSECSVENSLEAEKVDEMSPTLLAGTLSPIP